MAHHPVDIAILGEVGPPFNKMKTVQLDEVQKNEVGFRRITEALHWIP